MTNCLFASDLHGSEDRYLKLFQDIADERPAAVFLGGDLLPGGLNADQSGPAFLRDFVAVHLAGLRRHLADGYPAVFVIPGNDDPRVDEPAFAALEADGLWRYLHERHARFGDYDVYGYACVPPSPFLLKDWERYDMGRYVDPGCVSPEQGHRTVSVAPNLVRYGTIRDDLEQLVGDRDLRRAILLCHTPPHRTKLDRAALDGKMVDHVAVDVHVGSIAVRRFIEDRQPLITLHGHIHESARLTGAWLDRLGQTVCYSAAHDGPELALVRFRPEQPQQATRELL